MLKKVVFHVSFASFDCLPGMFDNPVTHPLKTPRQMVSVARRSLVEFPG